MNNRSLPTILQELTVLTAIGACIGCTLSLAASGFVIGVRQLTEWREQSALIASIGKITLDVSPLLFLWATALMAIAIREVWRIHRWHGPADSINAAHQTAQPLDIRHGLASTLAAFFNASGGASVGQYGPLVHFGATIGAMFRRWLPTPMPTEVYLGAGVAAAISAGFGAPLAGILFAHEVILRYFSVRALTPVAMASFTAYALSAQLFPIVTVFEIPRVPTELISTLPLLIIAGVCAAAVSILYMQALRFSASYATGSGWSPRQLIWIAATGCGLIGVWVPEILGLGIGTINGLFNNLYPLPMVLMLLLLKLIVTALCIGFGLIGGVFTPALYIGVATGAAIAQIGVALGFPEASVVLSTASMAGVAGAVVGAPIAAVLIALELTHSYDYGVAALVTVVITTMITQGVFGRSLFDRQLLDRGIDLSRGREWIALSNAKIEAVIKPLTPVIGLDTSNRRAVTAMQEASVSEACIVDAQGRLRGKLMLAQAMADLDQSVSDAMDCTPLTLSHTESISEAMTKLQDFVGAFVPVIDDTGRLLGAVTEGDILTAIIEIQSDQRQQERG